MPQAVELLELARARLGAGLTGFEVMGRFRARPGGPPLSRRCPGRCPSAPWTVLLEQSDNEGEAQARERFEVLLGEALERGLISGRRGGREPGPDRRGCGMCASRSRWRRAKKA
jgi:hypothetical protein